MGFISVKKPEKTFFFLKKKKTYCLENYFTTKSIASEINMESSQKNIAASLTPKPPILHYFVHELEQQ